MRKAISYIALAAAAILAQPGIATAGEAWDDIRDILFEDRAVQVASAADVTLMVPYRTSDDGRTQMGARVAAPAGAQIDKVYLVIDENPMPVSAVFDMQQPTDSFYFDMTFRLNGPSGVHLVMETDDGQLYVREAFAKTSGQGACAAPPGTDPKIALKTLGQMDLALVENGTTPASRLVALSKNTQPAVAEPAKVRIDFDHPSHSGLQKDQITLLYLPARFIETVEVSTVDQQPLFTMTGSISLSEDPALSIELPQGAGGLAVRMTDTEGAQFEELFSLGHI